MFPKTSGARFSTGAGRFSIPNLLRHIHKKGSWIFEAEQNLHWMRVCQPFAHCLPMLELLSLFGIIRSANQLGQALQKPVPSLIDWGNCIPIPAVESILQMISLRRRPVSNKSYEPLCIPSQAKSRWIIAKEKVAQDDSMVRNMIRLLPPH